MTKESVSMTPMHSRQTARLSGVLAAAVSLMAVVASAQPPAFLKVKMGLSDAAIQQVRQGQVVTKVLPSGDTKYGVLVLGAVYVNAPAEKFTAVFRDTSRLRQIKVYLDLQAFSAGGAPVNLSDFDRVTFGHKDIDALKDCAPGDCDLQAPNVEALRKQIKWDATDRYEQANRRARQSLFETMQQYRSGGLKALGDYLDRSKAFSRYNETKAMLDSSFYLTQATAPEIYRHVLDYPQDKLAGAEESFHWENIDFGQGPTVRLAHETVFPMGTGAAKPVAVSKQLWASHNIRMALLIFACVPDGRGKGFYLIEINDSRLPDFGGPKLSIARKIATSTSEQSVKDMLALYKAELGK